MMGASRAWSWREWSTSAWSRHLPEVSDHDEFVADLGEATIHALARRAAAVGPHAWRA